MSKEEAMVGEESKKFIGEEVGPKILSGREMAKMREREGFRSFTYVRKKQGYRLWGGTTFLVVKKRKYQINLYPEGSDCGIAKIKTFRQNKRGGPTQHSEGKSVLPQRYLRERFLAFSKGPRRN